MNNKPYRRTVRLQEYDYSQPEYYFITICTKNRECLFGTIVKQNIAAADDDDDVGTQKIVSVLSEIGKTVESCWNAIPNHYPNTSLGEYVIMPNHIHGILIIDYRSNINKITINNFELQNKFQKIIPCSVGSIIRGFKIGVTKWCRENTQYHDIWQGGFYERIVYDKESLVILRKYMRNNPVNWKKDKLYG